MLTFGMLRVGTRAQSPGDTPSRFLPHDTERPALLLQGILGAQAYFRDSESLE